MAKKKSVSPWKYHSTQVLTYSYKSKDDLVWHSTLEFASSKAAVNHFKKHYKPDGCVFLGIKLHTHDLYFPKRRI